MQELDQAKPLRHAMHVDVSVARENVKARLEAAVAAGGRIVDDSHAPSHWTLSDPAGNRVRICGWPDGFTVEREMNSSAADNPAEQQPVASDGATRRR
jgi:4a-hydroxytetrahydrobiopterin dehydratase